MKDKVIIEKIVGYINKLENYTDGTSFEAFSENSVLVEACVFNLSQIGELANKISPDSEEKYNAIPWRTMYGLRNKIVHDYEGVNLVLIWEIVSEDLPELKKKLERILQKM